jgi:hypothetical protein
VEAAVSAAVADAQSRTQEEVVAASAAMKAAAEAQQLRELEDKVNPVIPISQGCRNSAVFGTWFVYACLFLLMDLDVFGIQVDALQSQLASTTNAQLTAEAALQ